MHDEMLERRLREALRAEGDGLALTITAAELERRLVLRRRAQTSRGAGLLLAAAVGVGLVGAVGAATGWFDTRPGPYPSTPDASEVAVATSIASPITSPESSHVPSSGPQGLPTLDELIETVGTERVVAAQSFGRANGTEDAVPGGEPAAIHLGPVARPGPYRIWVVCLGGATIQLTADNHPEQENSTFRPVECTGEPIGFDETLIAGARVSVASPEAAGWRAVVAWQGDAVINQATSIVVPTPDPATILLDTGGGPADKPNYGPVPSAQSSRQIEARGPLSARDRYSVMASCAGPDAMRYGISRNGNLSSEDDWITQVELPCDGRLHEDELAFSLANGGSLMVGVAPTVQWRLMLVGEAPPFALSPNEAGWQLLLGYGPSLNLDPHPTSQSAEVSGSDRRIRVVVSCAPRPVDLFLGPARVDVTVDSGAQVIDRVGAFTVPCDADGASTVAEVVPLSSKGFSVVSTPSRRMWIVVTVQEPKPPS